ncbi:hypothetical protein FPK41_21365, partial [Acinetobacter baumannii]|nr:hypothetical protein [Acinetobacter baumannii]
MWPIRGRVGAQLSGCVESVLTGTQSIDNWQSRLGWGMLVKKAPLMWGLYCTPFQSDRELHGLSEGTGNNILLLFFGQG